jgi:hypothetical protein
MDLQETKKYRGYWWLPNNDSKPITGTLSIEPSKGIMLETIDSLISFEEVFNAGYNILKLDIILGQTVEGKAITLVDCHHSKSSFNVGEYLSNLSVSNYRANYALVGTKHFTSKDKIIFTSAEVRYSLVDEWLAISGFQRQLILDEHGYFKKMSIEYKHPEKIKFYVNSLNAYFYTNFVLKDNTNPLELHLVQKAFLRFIPDTEKSLDWYIKQFSSLQKLLTVITGYPVFPEEFVGYSIDSFDGEDTKTEFNIYNGFYEDFVKDSTPLLFRVRILVMS